MMMMKKMMIRCLDGILRERKARAFQLKLSLARDIVILVLRLFEECSGWVVCGHDGIV
jgi:hypothetical protein